MSDVYVCVCVCVRACVLARVCVCVCVRACVYWVAAVSGSKEGGAGAGAQVVTRPLKQDPNTHKRFRRMLNLLGQKRSLQMFGVIPFIKLQNDNTG